MDVVVLETDRFVRGVYLICDVPLQFVIAIVYRYAGMILRRSCKRTWTDQCQTWLGEEHCPVRKKNS